MKICREICAIYLSIPALFLVYARLIQIVYSVTIPDALVYNAGGYTAAIGWDGGCVQDWAGGRSHMQRLCRHTPR